MADTTTTNYGLVKPELKSVGWGEKINDDLDAIDARMRLNEVSASDKVPLTRTVNSKALSANIVLTTADVASSTDKRYVTDAQLVVIGNTSGTNTGDQTLPVKATGVELNTGTDDAKFATAKALADSDYAKTSDIPSVPVKATGAEADTGTNDDKFLTAKAAKDSHNIPSVAPGDSGNVLTSDGTDWTSAAPAVVSADMEYADTRFALVELTRDLTATNGDVAYTGAGFAPKAVVVVAASSATGGTGFSVGHAVGNPGRVIAYNQPNADNTFIPANEIIRLYNGTGTGQTAVVKTLDADGFTLTWTKVGTPGAGTAYVYALCLR